MEQYHTVRSEALERGRQLAIHGRWGMIAIEEDHVVALTALWQGSSGRAA